MGLCRHIQKRASGAPSPNRWKPPCCVCTFANALLWRRDPCSIAGVTPVDKFRPSCIQCRTWASCMAERAQRGRGVEAAVLASEAALSRDDIIMSLDAYKHFDEMSPELSVGLLEHEFTNASTRSGLSMNAKGGDANTDGCSLVVLLIVLPSMRLGASKLRTLWFRWQWFARTGNRQGCAGFRCRGCIAAARFRKRAGGVRSCCCAWCLDLLGLAYSAGLKGNLKKLAAVCRILWKALVQGGVPALSFTDSAKVFGEDFDVGEAWCVELTHAARVAKAERCCSGLAVLLLGAADMPAVSHLCFASPPLRRLVHQ